MKRKKKTVLIIIIYILIYMYVCDAIQARINNTSLYLSSLFHHHTCFTYYSTHFMIYEESIICKSSMVERKWIDRVVCRSLQTTILSRASREVTNIDYLNGMRNTFRNSQSLMPCSRRITSFCCFQRHHPS